MTLGSSFLRVKVVPTSKVFLALGSSFLRVNSPLPSRKQFRCSGIASFALLV